MAIKSEEYYFTDPIPYQMELFNLYKSQNQFEKALKILDNILENQDLEDNLKFKLHCYKGQLLSKISNNVVAEKEFNQAIEFILKEPQKLKPLGLISASEASVSINT